MIDYEIRTGNPSDCGVRGAGTTTYYTYRAVRPQVVYSRCGPSVGVFCSEDQQNADHQF
jgi:hypothetical protein